MAEYAGMSLRDIYTKKCEEMRCKRNSLLASQLPSKPDMFEIPTTIDLSNNFVGARGLVPLMEVVRCCTGLTSLILRDQQMTNESVVAVCAVVSRHPTIIKLDLSNNPLTITAGAALIDLTKNNPVIEQILLENTEIRGALTNSIQVQLARNRRSKGIAAGENVDGNPPAAAADEKVSNEKPHRVMDQSIVRSTLAALPCSVDPTLFDENPVDALNDLCKRMDATYYDTQFPPEPISVQRVVTADYGDYQWKRACDLSLEREGDGAIKPQIYPKDDSLMLLPHSLDPSFSWLFTCIDTCLTPQQIRGLVTPSTVSPYGVYSVKLHVDGKARWVVVDDMLPVDRTGKPIFAHPSHSEYLWPCLVQKAVAKLHGGYQALDQSLAVRHPIEKRVSCATVMCDLCGGVGISRDLHHEEFNSEDWWNTLTELNSNNSTYLVATSNADDDGAMQQLGITPGHAYQIQHVRQINGFRLLHLSSSWATRKYVGEWSDRSPLWEQYPHINSALDFRNKDATSFWIPYVKFLQLFSSVHLCRTFPDTQARLLEGAWTSQSSGGAYFDPSWTANPRYKFSMKTRGSVFINLAIPDERFTESDLDALAFHVFRGEQYPIRYDKDQLEGKTSYVITNSISFDGVFEEGDYWIVPSTYAAGRLGKFLLKCFSTSPFMLRHENMLAHWKCQEDKVHVESSGEYQNGENNPQWTLKVEPSEQPARVLIRMLVPDSEQYNIALFLCHAPKPGRMLGPIADEHIIAKSKFLISNTVTLEALLPGGDTNYVIVPCINPEKTSANVQLTVWSRQAPVKMELLPMWHKKTVVCEWEASGAYQDSTRNPQIELITPIPNQVFVITMSVTLCADPSIILFVVNNNDRVGEPIKGKVPDERIVTKSTYVRYESVITEFHNGPNPNNSYILLPCLQPPGSHGRCVVTVSCENETFQLHPLGQL